MAVDLQDLAHAASLTNPEAFWTKHSRALHWHRQPTCSLSRSSTRLDKDLERPHWSWFKDGEISTSYNCIDRHVLQGHGEASALIWESPVTSSRSVMSYKQLLDEVEVFAGVLREEGLRRGDIVLLYMPMIPAVVVAMLAIGRIGAVFTAVFGGFSSPSLAQRLTASKAAIILTASCGIEGSKPPIGYKELIRAAISISGHQPCKTIIWQREQLRWTPLDKEQGERNWERLVKSARNRGVKAGPVPVKSQDPLYIIYTSGTTGKPKGVLREAGGHAVALNYSIQYCFGISRGDTIFTASDTAWVVGTSYIVFAPLLVGATTILFEGKPVGAPDAGVFWRIIQQHKVKTMFTSPTALRAIRMHDKENSFLHSIGRSGGLRSLNALFLAGERSEPYLIDMYQELLHNYCAPNAAVVDNWWSSETGSPITAIAQNPGFRADDVRRLGAGSLRTTRSVPRAGSAGKPMPGFDVKVVNERGQELPRGSLGNIVLGIPLAPSAFTTLFNDKQRFWSGYLERFNGKWIDTGDAGLMDNDGYLHVMSRTDDIINVAAHRLSTGEIEQVIASHPAIAECCVVGMPDSVKGSLPFAFASLTASKLSHETLQLGDLLMDIQKMIRRDIGAIAALGGLITVSALPRTRSGKTLRRVLRDLLESAVDGDHQKVVQIPPTIEDMAAVDAARKQLQAYFGRGAAHHTSPPKPKL